MEDNGWKVKQKYKKKADDAQTNEKFKCVADKHCCKRGPGGEKYTGLQPEAIFLRATEAEK